MDKKKENKTKKPTNEDWVKALNQNMGMGTGKKPPKKGKK